MDSTPGGFSAKRLRVVWFADVASYTRLSSENEPLALTIVQALQRAADDVVTHQNGRIVKFLGDGVLAEFDSAGHAVEAAVSLRDRFHDETVNLSNEAQHLRIGIHVGEVTSGEDRDLYGDVINRASRLQGGAGLNQILVSGAVRGLLERDRRYVFDPVGRRSFKGLDDPIDVFSVHKGSQRVGGATSKPPRHPSWARRRTPGRAGAIGMATGIIVFVGLGVWTAASSGGGPGGSETGAVQEDGEGAPSQDASTPGPDLTSSAGASPTGVAVGASPTDSGEEDIPEAPAPGTGFKSCPRCPEMAVLPPGTFMMGSPDDELGRYDAEGARRTTEVRAFAVGRYEVTVDQFSLFLEETGRSQLGPDFPQDGSHPAVSISWQDATEYSAWLGDKTGLPYRLLTEGEWEYAARAGSHEARWWGPGVAEVCGRANVSGASHGCSDRHIGTSPVGTYKANSFGLYDVIGNAWEWVQECWLPEPGMDEYGYAVIDPAGECTLRVKKGGAWNSGPRNTRAAARGRDRFDRRIDTNGFRVVLSYR